MHQRDKALLEQIKSYFGGVGNITKHGKDSIQYRVNSIKDLTNTIIPHFDKYPLITKKLADGEARSASTFKQILSLWSMNLFKLYFI
jgi:hypothetical protein